MTDIQYRINKWGNETYSVHRITRTKIPATSFWTWFWPKYNEEAKMLANGIPDEKAARKIMMDDVQKQDPERPLNSTCYNSDGSLHHSHMPM